ncbi:NAD-dependent epimerase/dehydratase family protein [Levilactobacillus bambusae]|uniref:Aldehyde reductase n=1 Tax=Levilactobacillus bambusae TaxID=2024736 RepID=A0A2V1MZI5_9LACO|nr:NAD-dependent epimerase/dehydratase family protein [Levilactobacillus bambusae]PWG00424.1 aldehyde reductase [Levilactobacillus bambusae]
MTEKVLVTGGNGFLGLNILAELLTQGFEVRSTLRNLDKQGGVVETLQQSHVPNLDRLSFAQADLSKDAGWDEAMQGITYVLSVASPVFMNADHPAEMERAAKDGTLWILKAADNAHVKRVVMTANFGAVGFSNFDHHSITDEADWTNPDEPGLSPYEKSKLLAEQAAWHYIQQSPSNMELTTVNPVAILGPALDHHVSGSFGVVKGVVDGSSKRTVNLELNLVDVRDVADLHVRAMTNPKAAGERFIASADGKISLPEIGRLVQQKRPALANQVATKILPNWLISLAAPFNERAKEGRLLLRMNRNVSNQKAKRLLGWQPQHDNAEIVLDTVDAMVANGMVSNSVTKS